MRVLHWRILIIFIAAGLILAGSLIGSALLVQNKDKNEQVDTTYLSERLKTAIENSVKRGRIIGYNLNEEMFKPIKGLDNPDVVPFLIDFIEKGPNLPGQKKLPLESYIECCYATLCLDYIGDKRAYEPLVKVMQEKDYLSDKYEIPSYYTDSWPINDYSAFALGYLGDSRAIEPLLEEMKKNRGYSGSVSAIQSIAKFRDISTIKPIITFASDLKYFKSDIDNNLKHITGTNYENESKTLAGKWQFWWEHRDEYAKIRFEQYYPDWEYAIKHAPENEARKNAAINNMLQGGIAALPLLMDAIAKGDDTLIPIAAGMIKQYKPNNYRTSGKSRPLSEKATIKETMKWWKENKDAWTLKDSD